MEPSSDDESFAWTNASSNSDDSDSVKSTSIMFKNKEIYNEEVNINNVNEESIPEKKPKKRKFRTKMPDRENCINSPKRTKIKEEPIEDSRKKHKKNKNKSDESLESSQESILHDDYYLNIKVKQEQENSNVSTNLKPKKKNKKRHIDNHSGNDPLNEIDTIKRENCVISEKEEKKTKKKKYKVLESDSFVSYEQTPLTSPKQKNSKSNRNMLVVESNDSKLIFEDDTLCTTKPVVQKKTKPTKPNIDDEINNEAITDTLLNDVSTESIKREQRTFTNQKKKKSKSNKGMIEDVSSGNDLIIEDKFSAEETVVQNKKKHSNQTPYAYSEIYGKEGANSLIKDKIDKVKNNLINAENIINNSTSSSETNDDNFESENILVNNNLLAKESPYNKSISSTITENGHKQGAPKLMDRLRFEEEEDSEVDSSRNNTHSSCFNKFLKANTNLQPVVGSFGNIPEITQNDEIRLIKCSHEVDILNFNNKDFLLDNKSKIKINGETYNGTLDEGIDNLTVMSTDKSEFVIKNVNINGIITFHKRLPKPHVHEDNVMVNNQTDFIPLPETKCRHPLLGFNYKNAINERKKKKKYNKDKEMDVTLTVKEPKVEVAEEFSRKKAKKRKHNNDNEIYVKKPKRVKQEVDSSEVWESEKAIEENLFSF